MSENKSALRRLIDSGLEESDPLRTDFFFMQSLRTVNIAALIMLAASPVCFVLYLPLGSIPLDLIPVLSFCTGIAALLTLRRTRNVRMCAHLVISVFLFNIAAACFYFGGFESNALIWFFLVPVVSGFMLGSKASLRYGILTFAIVAALFGLHVSPVTVPSILPENGDTVYYAVQIFTMLAVIILLLYVLLGNQARTLNRLYESEELSRRISKQAEKDSRTKSDFLANMSHEIRTPMNGIIGIMHVLLEKPMPEEQKNYLEIVSNSANALLSIINDILDFSKIEAGKLELDIRTFDLQMAIEDITAMPAMQARQKGIGFSHTIDPAVPGRVKGDPGRLRQVINNLAGNAIKFTEQGEVSLDVTLDSEEENSAVLLFSVNDTGLGIPPDKTEKLFTSFTQADSSTTRNYGGTGLGLSISKLLVEKMGGTIGVDSMEMVGSTFWFTVKMEKDLSCGSAEAGFDGIPEGLRVFLASDDPSACTWLEDLLGELNVETVKAENNSRALEVVREACREKAPFDVVLMDIQETDVHAETLGRRIKQDDTVCGARLAVLSAIGKKGDARRFEKAGFDAFLSRPVDKELLSDCLRAMMNRQRAGDADTSIITRHSISETRKYAIRILVVEDKETNLVVARALLNKLGFDPDSARNGEEAVEKVRSVGYDIVLMDSQMPVMDGFEATRRIRELETEGKVRSTRIIAMTANAFKQDREKCLEAGMDDFIAKPVQPKELSRIIARTRKTGPETVSAQDTGKIEVNERLETPPYAGVEENSGKPVFAEGEMQERFDGSEELIRTVIDSFLEEAPDTLDRMKSALADNDADSVKNLSHALKGSAANAGAERIREAALEMEKSAGKGEIDRVGDILSTMEDQLNHYIEETS
ncbi:MAG: response regulator [Desulfarculaceae bacterium]|nr:response regulator [Desulfarculaceae bacterium]